MDPTDPDLGDPPDESRELDEQGRPIAPSAASTDEIDDDDFPWESLDVPPWVVVAVGLSIIIIGVLATWKALT